MTITKKYSNCESCGANDYDIVNFKDLKCTYCGTVYEQRNPNVIRKDESGRIVSHTLISMDYPPKLETVRYDMGVRLIDRQPKTPTAQQMLVMESRMETLRKSLEPNNIFQDIGDSISSIGGMFSSLKSLMGFIK